jgi:hypothetical protein
MLKEQLRRVPVIAAQLSTASCPSFAEDAA